MIKICGVAVADGVEVDSVDVAVRASVEVIVGEIEGVFVSENGVLLVVEPIG